MTRLIINNKQGRPAPTIQLDTNKISRYSHILLLFAEKCLLHIVVIVIIKNLPRPSRSFVVTSQQPVTSSGN